MSSIADLNLPTDNFTEGIFIDYKHFIAQNITPRFEFGFGLTYTTFNYTNLEIRRTNVSTALVAPNPQSANATMPQGGLTSLWDVIAKVSVTVTNTGPVAAAEVAQLYIGVPGGPAKQLRGFDKQCLKPMQSKAFSFELTRRDLSAWSGGWMLQRGTYNVYVGKSVLDIQLTGTITI